MSDFTASQQTYMRCAIAAFSLRDMFQSSQPVLVQVYAYILAASINTIPSCVESSFRAVNRDVGDLNSGSLQMLLVLWSECHFIFPAVTTTQMFIYVSHIHFETLSRFQSLEVQFR